MDILLSNQHTSCISNDESKGTARAANPLHGWSPQTVSYRITSYYFQGKDLSGLVSE